MARLEAQGLGKTYPGPRAARPAVSDAHFSIADGELAAIVGRSGSGKSTLLSLLGLLDEPDTGRYLLDGVDVTGVRGARAARLRNRHIGFVFQSFHLLPRLDVRDNVALPALYAGLGRRQALAKAAALLDRFDVGPLARRLPGELSGGERQRVAICRSLVNEPGLLLADEPTGNLDTASAARVVDHLLTLHSEGLTVLLVTHDRELADRCPRRLTLADGRLVEDLR